jgi:hypothetical protein
MERDERPDRGRKRRVGLAELIEGCRRGIREPQLVERGDEKPPRTRARFGVARGVEHRLKVLDGMFGPSEANQDAPEVESDVDVVVVFLEVPLVEAPRGLEIPRALGELAGGFEVTCRFELARRLGVLACGREQHRGVADPVATERELSRLARDGAVEAQLVEDGGDERVVFGLGRVAIRVEQESRGQRHLDRTRELPHCREQLSGPPYVAARQQELTGLFVPALALQGFHVRHRG